ncbi:unnamed protein product [Fraxinus pennsylvanica]|uniref:Dirigent protein n=1 Tax=Fraxinus pennsylvanica TaxID=56036 RepID=A0AAD1ZNN8_9LAMI|nr:unnamed protein product [Fraxinus pennsylvanica]
MCKKSLANILLAILFATMNLGIFVAAVDPPAAAGGGGGKTVIKEFSHGIQNVREIISKHSSCNSICNHECGRQQPDCSADHWLVRQHLQWASALRKASRVCERWCSHSKCQCAIPIVNANGVPLWTGLAGTTFAGIPNGSNNNGKTINTQLGPDGMGLGFGTITVIDDFLTLAPELGSQQLGKAQGVYVASSADGSTQMMAFTAVMEGGEYGDSLNFFGVYKIGSTMSRLSITGGTGKFKNASGFAELRSLIPAGQHVLDGVEALLRITVHLTY